MCAPQQNLQMSRDRVMIDDLYIQAEKLTGRPVEVEKTKDNKYIVLYMNLMGPPPPKADTEEDSLARFIEWYLVQKVDTLPDEDLSFLESSGEEDEGADTQ